LSIDDVATTSSSSDLFSADPASTITLTGTSINFDQEVSISKDLTIANSANSIAAGVISGSSALTKSGSGKLTLSDTNTYTGDTTVSAGTLTVTGTLSDSTDVIVSSGATYDVDQTDTIQSLSGAGTINIASTKTLTTGDSGNDTISGIIEGAGSLVKQGTGTLTLSGTNTYSGNTTISAGGLTVSGQLGSGSYAGAIANSGTLTISSNSNQELSGVISGSGQIIKSGSGTLTLSGTNTFSTGTALTTQTDGTWGNIPNSNRAKNYSTSFASGIDTLPVIYNILNDVGGGNRDDFTTRLVSTSNSSFTYRVYRTDAGASISSTWGAVDGVTYFNVFPVAITVNGGTLALTNNNAIAVDNAIRVGSNATLDVKGVTISNPIRLDQNSILTNSSSTASEISGAVIITNDSTINGTGNIELSGLVNLPIGISSLGDVSLTKSGSNTLNLSGDNFEETNTDYSSYIGETILNAGTFSLGNVHSIGTLKSVKPKFTFGGGTLQFSSNNTTDISSIFSNSANQSYKIDTNGQSVTLASTLTSSGGTFEKKGTGTLTLSGNNTYDGDTTISAGTLKAGKVSSGTIGTPTAGPFGTGSLINNSTIDVDNKLIHNAKTTAGTIINKPSPTLSFTSANLSASDGDNVSNTLTHSGNGTIAYSSSSNSIATVDPSSGAVTLVGNGTVTITASATSSNEYADASTTYSLVVTGFGASNSQPSNSQQSQKASDNAVRNATNSIPKNNTKNTPTVNPTAGGGGIPGSQPLINFGGGFSGGGGANIGGGANTTAGTGQGAGGPGDGTGPGQGAGQGLGPQGGGSSGGGIINLGGGSSGGGGANTGGSANTTAGTGQGAGGPGDGTGPGQGAGQGLGPQRK
jgi:fibronectin-binding autotransporter adhesin